MWRQIRGMGLSYHYHMRCHIEAGYIKFILYRAAQVVQAFEEAKKIMVQQPVGSCSSMLCCAVLCVVETVCGQQRAAASVHAMTAVFSLVSILFLF